MNKLTKQDFQVLDSITKKGRFNSWKEKRKHETYLEEWVNLRIEEAVITSRLSERKRNLKQKKVVL